MKSQGKYVLFQTKKKRMLHRLLKRKRMESVFVPNKERSKIEYHRSRREQYRRYFQIKKGKEKTLFIYPRLHLTHRYTRVKFYPRLSRNERNRTKGEGKHCTPSITFIPSIKLWPTRHELCQLGQSELRDLVKMLMAVALSVAAIDGGENIGRLRGRSDTNFG